MRGKRLAVSSVGLRPRIIPARAGQTKTVILELSSGNGSSPRVRGKPFRARFLQGDGRIIPARAGQTRCTSPLVMDWTDHPRACGANLILSPPLRGPTGSSPRVRGKPCWCCNAGGAIRIIPARAGQTHCFAIWSASVSGSSPRVRGKHARVDVAFAAVRIIPARAGQTSMPGPPMGPSPDHPRACGANGRLGYKVTRITGSSPRVRGKLRGLFVDGAQVRIIPARAGQTRIPTGLGGRRPDHPRACGANLGAGCFAPPQIQRIIPARAGQTEPSAVGSLSCPDHPRACGANAMRPKPAVPKLGSSPRVRGKLSAIGSRDVQRRIIPARAGQTQAVKDKADAAADHPRACGANAVLRGGYRIGSGSSPRVRGKPWLPPEQAAPFRIIPARAGQTCRCSRSRRPTTDHPRACGANHLVEDGRQRAAGSSPRVRGKLGLLDLLLVQRRIIPARAGQTDTPVTRLIAEYGSSPRVRGKLSCNH